jgi:hypothetical protein
MSLSALSFQPASRASSCDRNQSLALQNIQNENTGDLQWKCALNYNAKPCGDERKVAGARTMDINEKTMRRTIGSKNTGE